MTTIYSMVEEWKRLQFFISSIEENRKFLENFKRENEIVAEWYKNTISKYMLQRGWYIGGSLGVSQLQQLKNAIKLKRESEIEKFLIHHVRSITKDTESKAYIRWPHRHDILADAFDAHFKKKYTLSVPVMLAQADGIAFDILGTFLFTKTRKISAKAKDLIEKRFKHRALAKSFLGLLLETSCINMHTEKRNQLKNEDYLLNRHGVLHGIDCDYPKECNSLKAISLINFLTWIHDILSKKK
jgi:hypothetical protein